MDEKKKIEELVKTLNEASEAYYNGQDEIMSNYEWDGMFDELTRLEEKTGYILPESPTQNAGFEGGRKTSLVILETGWINIGSNL